MPYKKVHIESDVEARAWEVFHQRLDFKDVLHNDLVRRLEEAQNKLEEVGPEELQQWQTAVKIFKALLRFIHKRDNQDLKDRYEY